MRGGAGEFVADTAMIKTGWRQGAERLRAVSFILKKTGWELRAEQPIAAGFSLKTTCQEQ